MPGEVRNGTTIRAVHVRRHYQMGAEVVRAVDGVSLDVRRGEFLALLGSSGSGKSTLMNLFAGLDRPTGGAIVVEGRDLAQLNAEDLARYRRHTVGMVFQSFNLVASMTLLENVELPLRLAETPREGREAAVRAALERVGLGARLKHRPSEMSGGEQQRAALARALVNRPSILLADEPTGNLDSRTGEEILRLISEINAQGTTVVIVTHERPLAERFANRITVLGDGRVISDGRNGPAHPGSAAP